MAGYYPLYVADITVDGHGKFVHGLPMESVVGQRLLTIRAASMYGGSLEETWEEGEGRESGVPDEEDLLDDFTISYFVKRVPRSGKFVIEPRPEDLLRGLQELAEGKKMATLHHFPRERRSLVGEVVEEEGHTFFVVTEVIQTKGASQNDQTREVCYEPIYNRDCLLDCIRVLREDFDGCNMLGHS